MPQRRFVVLDRDGTIIRGVQPYVLNPEEVEMLPGAVEGLRLLQSLGLGLIVVANQSAIGRGLLDRQRFSQIQQRFFEVLENEGIRLDGVYICPHHPDDGCVCRKPQTSLIEQAISEHGFDPQHSFIIGDDAKDIELGQTIGATTILVSTGHGQSFLTSGLRVQPHYVVADLPAAASVIQALVVDGSAVS